MQENNREFLPHPIDRPFLAHYIQSSCISPVSNSARTIIVWKLAMIQPELNKQQLAELTQMLKIAKNTEQKVRELNELAIGFEAKWKSRLEDRRNKKQQVSQSS